MIFLITGPSGAGKTTVAAALARRFERSVHLEGDVFRRMIVSGRREMTPDAGEEELAQLRLRYRLAAATADAYACAGLTVVLEDVVAGPMLDELTELVRTRPLHVVVLMPQLEVVAERNASRTSEGYREWSLEELYRVFEDTPRRGLWLDTTGESAGETVERILESAAS